MIHSYPIHQLRPLIAWPYFLWAWGMHGKPEADQQELLRDADAMLDSWEGKYHTQILLQEYQANSHGDDIVLHTDKGPRLLPMLRQQKPEKDSQYCLCLADYVKPTAMGSDTITLFATSMQEVAELHSDDPYTRMMAQTLSDRLAEATAEMMSKETPGIRPAVGYPSMPDMSINFLLDEMLHMQDIGIQLTESGMMIPHASISGIVFHHPEARYFNISKIGTDQLADYARRRGMTPEEMQRFIKI